MSEEVKIILSAEDRASAEIDKLRRSIERLKKSIGSFSNNPMKGQFSSDMGAKVREDLAKTQANVTRGLDRQMIFQARMNRQRLQEERAVTAEQARQDRARRIGEDRAMQDLRQRTTAETRSLREQAGMARDAERARVAGMREAIRLDNYRFGLQRRYERETQREQAAAIRRQIDLDRYRMGVRERSERQEAANERRAQAEVTRSRRGQERQRGQGRRDLRSAWNSGNEARREVMSVARTATISGGIVGGILEKIAETGLGARSRADSAEANLRMFGGLSRDQVNAARSGWLNSAAIANGFRPADAINSFTEVLKAGIPEIAAPDVTKSIMGASAGLDLNVAETTKLVGRLSTLTQDPKAFSAGAIDKMLNGIAVVAKVTAADSKELVSSLRRGAGALGSSKMSVEDLTAFTGVGISAGMQEGKAGTFMDFLVNELVNAKNAHGQRREDLTRGFNLLNLGSASAVSQQAAKDPTKLLLNMFDRMSKMSPERAGQVASLIGMREWRGELLQMMKANPMLRQTVEAERDPKNAGHLAQARNEKLGTLEGLRDQLRSTFDLAWEAIGGGIEDIVREIGAFFLNLGGRLNLDVIKVHVASLLNGFVDGLGFKNITEMLNKVFGQPDFSTVDSFFRFAQGFGQGIRDVVYTIKSAFSAFTGRDADAETLGNFTGKIIGFSAALVVIGPLLGVIAAFSNILTGLGFAISGMAKGAAGLGLLGGAGAAGVMATAGGLIGVAFLATIANKLGILKAPDPSKGIGRGIVEFLDPRIAELVYGKDDGIKDKSKGSWVDPPAKVQKQSFDNDGSLKGLIQKASFNEFNERLGIGRGDYAGFRDKSSSTDRVAEGIGSLKSMIQLASLTGGGLGSIGAAMSGSSGGGGGAGGGVSSTGGSGGFGDRLGGNFFTPEGMKVPGTYGKGGGSGNGSALGVPDIGPMTADEKNKLGLIMKYEGGYKNQMNYAGKAQGLDPNTAKGSTAQGYFQILNTNWRRLAPKLGITTTNAMSSPLADQARVALALMRDNPHRPGGGIQNWINYNPKLRAALARGEQAPAGVPNITPGGAVASVDPNVGINIPGLGLGKGQYDGLRVKGGQATANGLTELGVTDLARQAQENLPGGVKHFGAFNDRYHAGTKSKHALGLAFDTTLNNAGLSAQAAQAMRDKIKASGLDESQFKVIDEYLNPSSRSTGGHIHTQFNSKDAAKRYHDYIAGLEGESKKAVASVNGIGEKAKAAEGVNLSPSVGRVDVGGGLKGVPFGAKPTTDEVVSNVPAGIGRGGAGGVAGGGGGRGSFTVHQTINGAGENPQVLAQKAQRAFEDASRNSAHAPELI